MFGSKTIRDLTRQLGEARALNEKQADEISRQRGDNERLAIKYASYKVANEKLHDHVRKLEAENAKLVRELSPFRLRLRGVGGKFVSQPRVIGTVVGQ